MELKGEMMGCWGGDWGEGEGIKRLPSRLWQGSWDGSIIFCKCISLGWKMDRGLPKGGGGGCAEQSRWRYSIALQASKHAELCTELWTVSETLLWLNTLHTFAAPPHPATRTRDFFTVNSCPLHCLMLTKFFKDCHFYDLFSCHLSEWITTRIWNIL